MKLVLFNPRQRTTVLFILGLIIIFGGLFIWALKTGRIKIGAEGSGQTVEGYVYNRQGQPISGVRVYEANHPNNFYETAPEAVTDGRGYYVLGLGSLDISEATIKFEKNGETVFSSFPDTQVDNSNSGAYFLSKMEIGALRNAGVVVGYPDGNYHPHEYITRAQMAVYITRALFVSNGLSDSDIAVPQTNTFSDVPTNHWAFKYIEYLYSQGAVSGYPDRTFRPDDWVDAGQIAVFIAKALKLELHHGATPTFYDVPVTHWAYDYIETLTDYGGTLSFYINPSEINYHPDFPITRAMMAVFIARSFQAIPMTPDGYNFKVVRLNLTQTDSRHLNVYLDGGGKVGIVSGQVKDNRGAPVVGAKVVLGFKPAINEEYSATTDDSGRYTIFNVPSGHLIYHVHKPHSGETYKLESPENMIYAAEKRLTTLNLTVE